MLQIFFTRLPFDLSDLLWSLIILVIFILLAKLLTYIFQIYVSKWTKQTATQVDDLIVEKIKPPFTYVIWLLGLRLALVKLNLQGDFFDKLVKSIILVVVVWVVVAVADVVMAAIVEKIVAKTETEVDDALAPLVTKSIKVIIWSIGIIWLLGIWQIDVRPILGGLGIAGLALGFAVKDSLANIFGGIALILDRTIKVGDKVKLESGEFGFIEDVGLRSTKLKTFSNEIITIPNGQLANSRIQNYGQPDPSLKVIVDFSVAYKSDVDNVRKVVSQAIGSMEGIMQDPPVEVLFLSMEDFYLKFSARFWVPDHTYAWDKQLEATDKIFKTLKENSIEIPYPIQTIKLEKKD